LNIAIFNRIFFSVSRLIFFLGVVNAIFLFSQIAYASSSITFTINMDTSVVVTGTPRIQMDVGGTTRFANYTSGSGTNALIFSYAIVSGDVDTDGVVLTSPIQLNSGTIKDLNGNDAVLTFIPPNTSGVLVNAAVPSGYIVALSADTVTNANKSALSFTLTYPKANKTLNYSISSSGGGTPITGTATTTVASTIVSSIDVTSLPDGLLTLSVFLSDSVGGTGVTVTDTIPMAVLDGTLLGHWTFDAGDISGATAFDRSGQAINGTLTNGPTQVTGVIGGALNFDGTDDFVQSTPVIGASATFSYWATWTGATNRMPFALRTGSPGPDVFFSSGLISWNTYDSAANPFASIPATASNGSYQHYVVVVTAAETRLYYNGSSIGTAIYRSPAFSPLQIGGHNTYRWPGRIDDFRVYNRALTAAEVTRIYNAR
jgi:hypothetical protein